MSEQTPEQIANAATHAPVGKPHYMGNYEQFGQDEYGRNFALMPLPKDMRQLGCRLVSDGTPVGTHLVLYDPKTKLDVGELANVQCLSFKMNVADIFCEVEMVCIDVPLNLEIGKPKYALGSADPVSIHKMKHAGIRLDERLIPKT